VLELDICLEGYAEYQDFVSFFGQLVGKAAAEITFADSVWAVEQTAGADFAQLL